LVLRRGRPAMGEHGREDWRRKASLLCLPTSSDTSKMGIEMKKWRGRRRKEVRIKFIESWNNVLNEECDI
jgi:hypothetical protein